jgi:carboxypeptidase C (cathepsin A)
MLVGTFPSNNYGTTTNSSANSARALWYSLQVFLQDFPEYRPKEQRISLWTESYGGKYGPATTAFIQRQNQKLASGSISNRKFKHINLETLGIVSGCIDFLTEQSSSLRMAFNNTYGLQIINQSAYKRAVSNLSQRGGCIDAITRCRQLAAQRDPTNQGGNSGVNSACLNASVVCSGQKMGVSGRSSYDIAAPAAGMSKRSLYNQSFTDRSHPDPFPESYMIGYLAQRSVQAALGAPLNYTDVMESVNQVFSRVGDIVRGGFIEDIGFLLNSGVKVAMMYGDRDMVRLFLAIPTAKR